MLLSPLSSWTINHRNPEFRTSTHSEYREYINEICETRACAPPIVARWTHSGTPSPSPVAIPPGRLFYWRSTGVLRDGRMRTSPAVPFKTTTRATRGYDTVFFDFDGDGFADVLTKETGGLSTNGRTQVVFGSADFRVVPRTTLELVSMPGSPWMTDLQSHQLIGDFDGDGFSDVALVGQQLQIHFGSSRSRAEQQISTNGRIVSVQSFGSEWVSRSIAPIGDINNDGRADLILSDWNFSTRLQDLSLILGSSERIIRAHRVVSGISARTLVRGPECAVAGRERHFTYSINRTSAVSMVAAATLIEYSQDAFTEFGGEIPIDFPYPVIEDVGDIDGDGRNEAVVHSIRYSDSRAVLLTMPECGRLQAVTLNLVPNAHAVARTTDIDGDGTHELIFGRVATTASPQLIVAFRGGSDYATSPLAVFSRDSSQLSIGTLEGDNAYRGIIFGSPGDMNGDGFDDLPLGTLRSGQPQFIMLRGTGDLSRWPGEPISLREPGAGINVTNDIIASRSSRSVRRWLFARR